jgi:hypothetical protein
MPFTFLRKDVRVYFTSSLRILIYSYSAYLKNILFPPRRSREKVKLEENKIAIVRMNYYRDSEIKMPVKLLKLDLNIWKAGCWSGPFLRLER